MVVLVTWMTATIRHGDGDGGCADDSADDGMHSGGGDGDDDSTDDVDGGDGSDGGDRDGHDGEPR